MFDRWMDKEDVVYIQWNITIYKKEWNLSICDNMDKSRGHYAKWNKSGRERQVYYFAYLWNLKIKNEQTKQKRNRLIDTEKKLVVNRGEEGGRLNKIGEVD